MNALTLTRALATPILALCCLSALVAAAEPGFQGEAQPASEQSQAGNEAEVNPMPESEPTPETPKQDWVHIEGSDSHVLNMQFKGSLILSLENAGRTLLNVEIFNGRGELIGEFDSDGCGILLMSENLQNITVVIHNYFRFDNHYILHVY